MVTGKIVYEGVQKQICIVWWHREVSDRHSTMSEQKTGKHFILCCWKTVSKQQTAMAITKFDQVSYNTANI